jgi:hypothetical protein
MFTQVRCGACHARRNPGEPGRWCGIGVGAGQAVRHPPKGLPRAEMWIAEQVPIGLDHTGRNPRGTQTCGKGGGVPRLRGPGDVLIEKIGMPPSHQAVGKTWIMRPRGLAEHLTQSGPWASSSTRIPASDRSTTDMMGASRAESEEFVKASGATEKVLLPPNLAADCFGTRQVQMTHGIAHHLLRDCRRRSSSGLSWDASLGE